MSLMRHAITILSCFLICSVEAFIALVLSERRRPSFIDVWKIIVANPRWPIALKSLVCHGFCWEFSGFVEIFLRSQDLQVGVVHCHRLLLFVHALVCAEGEDVINVIIITAPVQISMQCFK